MTGLLPKSLTEFRRPFLAAVAATVALGILPGPLLELAQQASVFVR